MGTTVCVCVCVCVCWRGGVAIAKLCQFSGLKCGIILHNKIQPSLAILEFGDFENRV